MIFMRTAMSKSIYPLARTLSTDNVSTEKFEGSKSNSKLQIRNSKQIPMSKRQNIQNACIRPFECDLRFEIFETSHSRIGTDAPAVVICLSLVCFGFRDSDFGFNHPSIDSL